MIPVYVLPADAIAPLSLSRTYDSFLHTVVGSANAPELQEKVVSRKYLAGLLRSCALQPSSSKYSGEPCPAKFTHSEPSFTADRICVAILSSTPPTLFNLRMRMESPEIGGSKTKGAIPSN